MKKLLFCLAFFGTATVVFAQTSSPKLWFGRLDLYHQDYIGDFSFGQLAVHDPVHIRPGFRIGIERSWVTKNHFRLYQDVLFGYYHNTYDERSWTFGTDIGFEWRIFKEFRLALPIGLHYNNAKAIDIRYQYVGDKWVKSKNTDPSINRLQIPIGLNLGWRFLPNAAHPVDAFLNGTVSAIGPWQSGSGVPVLFYKAVGLGIRVGL